MIIFQTWNRNKYVYSLTSSVLMYPKAARGGKKASFETNIFEHWMQNAHLKDQLELSNIFNNEHRFVCQLYARFSLFNQSFLKRYLFVYYWSIIISIKQRIQRFWWQFLATANVDVNFSMLVTENPPPTSQPTYLVINHYSVILISNWESSSTKSDE